MGQGAQFLQQKRTALGAGALAAAPVAAKLRTTPTSTNRRPRAAMKPSPLPYRVPPKPARIIPQKYFRVLAGKGLWAVNN